MKKRLLFPWFIVSVLLLTTGAQSKEIAKPEMIWPISWVSLGTSVLLLCDLIARAFGVYKVGAGSIKAKLDEQTAHFDEKMNQVEQRLEQKFNGFTSSTEYRMNGFGGRLENVESDQVGANAKISMVESRMAASEMDREHIRRDIGEIKAGQDIILQHILNQRRG